MLCGDGVTVSMDMIVMGIVLFIAASLLVAKAIYERQVKGERERAAQKGLKTDKAKLIMKRLTQLYAKNNETMTYNSNGSTTYTRSDTGELPSRVDYATTFVPGMLYATTTTTIEVLTINHQTMVESIIEPVIKSRAVRIQAATDGFQKRFKIKLKSLVSFLQGKPVFIVLSIYLLFQLILSTSLAPPEVVCNIGKTHLQNVCFLLII